MKELQDDPLDFTGAEETPGPTRKSKTQRKKEMIELQKLGERLVTLSEKNLRALDIPEELREAVRFAKTIRSHSARKRQRQHIGAIMRNVDPQPIRRAFQQMDDMLSQDAHTFQRIEKLRDELIAGDDDHALRVLKQFPRARKDEFLQLVVRARSEGLSGKHTGASRALFRYLRTLFESSGTGSPSS